MKPLSFSDEPRSSDEWRNPGASDHWRELSGPLLLEAALALGGGGRGFQE